ncbi:MAG: hypothetical protein N3D12_00005 [Candidatus Methanomethyliaceae archaeon]|nr:hypothetical protein [Candidatus Methanomethyliaceae archaeon]
MSEEDKKDWLTRYYESNVREYFPVCPLCGHEELDIEFSFLEGDFLTCKRCAATWHLYIGITGLKWAELTLPTRGGYGRHLLNQKIDCKYWKEMCREKFTIGRGLEEAKSVDIKILKEAEREEKVKRVKKKIKALKEKAKDAQGDLERARYDLERARYDKDPNELERAYEELERAQEELERCQEELEREIKKLNSLLEQY